MTLADELPAAIDRAATTARVAGPLHLETTIDLFDDAALIRLETAHHPGTRRAVSTVIVAQDLLDDPAGTFVAGAIARTLTTRLAPWLRPDRNPFPTLTPFPRLEPLTHRIDAHHARTQRRRLRRRLARQAPTCP